MEDKALLFLTEFTRLLEKYNAEIYADMEGDTHGVSVDVVIDINNKEIYRKSDSISNYDICL